MTTGMVFDIREFALHDGPGIRTTVFMKGCPLRCRWCHNPEGQSSTPQVMRSPGGERVVGREYAPAVLASILNRQSEILTAAEGGVTFSGGEPLQQAHFVAAVIDLLQGLHIVLDTSGHAPPEEFRSVAERVDLIYFDLKLMDSKAHQRFTGVGNGPILANLRALDDIGKPFVIRVPLVPGVTDTDDNLGAIAKTVQGMRRLLRVELLPYNRFAGGKYESLGMRFEPGYDESVPPRSIVNIFESEGLKAGIA